MSESLPATIEAVDAELGAINVGSAAYWRDEGQQARYRDLLARREDLQATAEPQAEVENPIDILSPAQFQAACPDVDYADYLAVMRDVADVYLHVPEGQQAELVASFGALPDSVVGAMITELGNRSSVFPQADETKGVARLQRLHDGLSVADRRVLMAWIDGLPDDTLDAVLRKLDA